MNDPFYILSIDGGGYRGLFAAHVLKRIEECMGISWRQRFGMMAGTSTGSILAAGLAYGLTATCLERWYKSHGPQIFKRCKRSFFDRWQ